MCERVYTVALNPILFEMGCDHPYVLVEGGLGQLMIDNSLGAIVHVAFLRGTLPVRSDIPGQMYAQSISLPFGRVSVLP
jgi:hypothetical protein